jgi:hypothetical protein
MKNLMLLVLICSLLSCKKEKDVTTESGIISAAKKDSVTIEEFERALNQLPDSISSLLKGLEIFKNDFDKSNPETNDKAFKIYLAFQTALIDSLNQQLMENPNYEKISSLIWADTSLHEKEGKRFASELKQNGLTLESSEGMIYIDRETKILRDHFFEWLTPPSQKFFNQFESETNQPESSDGGFIIPMKDFADRLGFWDTFQASYPSHMYSTYARNNVEYNLYFFMIGLDNTPAFSYDDGKLDKEFLEAYKYFIQKYPDVKSAGVMKEYLQLLEKAGYKQTEEVKAFSAKYNPYK